MNLERLENLLILSKELYPFYEMAFIDGLAIDDEDIEEMARILIKIENKVTKREYKRLLKKIFYS